MDNLVLRRINERYQLNQALNSAIRFSNSGTARS